MKLGKEPHVAREPRVGRPAPAWSGHELWSIITSKAAIVASAGVKGLAKLQRENDIPTYQTHFRSP